MDKVLLEIVNNFPEWKGNPFTLAALIVDKQKDIDRQKLIDAGFTDAAEVI